MYLVVKGKKVLGYFGSMEHAQNLAVRTKGTVYVDADLKDYPIYKVYAIIDQNKQLLGVFANQKRAAETAEKCGGWVEDGVMDS